MSHYAMTKMKIKNANKQVLKRAIENVAKRIGAHVVTEIEDYYGKRQKVKFMGLKSNRFYRGVEIFVDEHGNVQLGGDFYGYQREINELKNQITMEYTALATQISLEQMGYVVQNIQYRQQQNKLKAIEIDAAVVGGGW